MIVQNKSLIGGALAALVAAAAGGFAVARCTTPRSAETANTTQSVAESEPEAPTDRIAMAQAAITEAAIVLEPVGSGSLDAETVVQGLVAPAPSGAAVVTARVGGAVTRVFKRLGDAVRAGETLAIIESREAAQIAADRTAAAARASLAQRNLARERYLLDQRVSPRVDYERAQAEAVAATAEARRASVAAGAARLTGDGRGVLVASPISGRVTVSSVALGAFVQPESELFRVADPQRVQIEAAVGAAAANRLQVGDAAVIELPDGRSVAARVRGVTPTLNGDTRTATAVLEANEGGLTPGLAVRVRLPLRGASQAVGVAVSEEAVQSINGREVVFVRTPTGFRVQNVTTGRRSAGRVQVVSGLTAGQVIATRNAFLLKAELAKGSGEEE